MRIWLSFLIAASIGITGCASAEEAEVPTKTVEYSNSELKNKLTVPSASEPETISRSEAESSSAEEVSHNTERILSEEELAGFRSFFNDRANNGFLQTSYVSPEYMDLEEVLYNGGGMSGHSLTEAEKQAFLNASGGTEIQTDVLHLTTAQIEEYLQEKAGIGLKDLKTEFQWVYVPELDSYFKEHGDTNYMSFVCSDGTEQNGIYSIHCVSDDFGTGVYDIYVKVKQHGQSYQFISNERTGGPDWMQPETESEADMASLNSFRAVARSYRSGLGKTGDGFSDSIFNSDLRFYRAEELASLNTKLYAVFRNEIYARHGYVFKNQVWNDFFSDYSWYQGRYAGDQFDNGWLNEFEEENLKRILELER